MLHSLLYFVTNTSHTDIIYANTSLLNYEGI